METFLWILGIGAVILWFVHSGPDSSYNDMVERVGDAVFYNAENHGEILSKGREFLISWDQKEVFRRSAFPDGRFFEEFVIPGLSSDEAKKMADDCLAEWDLEIDEESGC